MERAFGTSHSMSVVVVVLLLIHLTIRPVRGMLGFMNSLKVEKVVGSLYQSLSSSLYNFFFSLFISQVGWGREVLGEVVKNSQEAFHDLSQAEKDELIKGLNEHKATKAKGM
jgi:hypothetical protein